jgi:RNA polymerase sigma factor (sigma-70 family)
MENRKSDDYDLVEAFLRRRDEGCFRQLYQRHTPALFALAMRMVGGLTADAEDVVQETWLRAARSLRDFEWRSSLRTWLCGIAINCSRETRSKHAAMHRIEFEPISNEPPANTDLEQMIYRLPNGYREVFVLHDIEGYTHQEIGRQLGIQEGTSKSQLFEARRWLRSRLQSMKRAEGGSL